MLRPPDFCKAEALLVEAGVKIIKKNQHNTSLSIPTILHNHKIARLPTVLPTLHLYNTHEY